MIANDTSAGGPTVKPAEAEIAPILAVMVDDPIAVVLASPVELTLAALVEEFQFNEPVRFCVLPSV